jgi:ankyrin repeat protein
MLENALFAAIRRGDLGAVQDIIDTDRVSINARDGWDNTPLDEAVLCKQPDIIRCLLANGARPLDKDDRGVTALSLAGSELKAEFAEFGYK